VTGHGYQEPTILHNVHIAILRAGTEILRGGTIPKIEKFCKVCGKSFMSYAYQNQECDTRKCFYKSLERKETRICEQCGEPFERRPHETDRFCGPECYGKSLIGKKQPQSQIDKRIASVKALPRKRRCKWVTLICPCDTIFECTPSEAKRGRKYCGKPCDMLSKFGKPKSEAHKKKISDSLMEHPVSDEVRAILKEKSTGVIKSPETIAKLIKSLTGGKRTPEQCRNMSLSKQWDKNPAFKGGISREPYCYKWDHPLRERVRIFFGRICAECGKTEEENGQRLSVHHVNYDKQTCCHDGPRLLIALCKSHNTIVNSDREHWKEHFTQMINEKYGGQCYISKEEYADLLLNS
jgi:hypothetical protein